MKPTVVIFSGAGLSAESGVPTFRDSNGLWENHRVEDVATPEGWRRDKELVLKFYEQRFHGVRNCEPNAAHKAIAQLQEKFHVINITQNIDDLLERAGVDKIFHLHGSIFQRKCEKHTSCSNPNRYSCDYLVEHDTPVKKGDMCPKCGAQLRPNVVWFGESVDMREDYLHDLLIYNLSKDGIFIVVGTSAQVWPAAGLIEMFRSVPYKYIIDKNPPKHPNNYTILEGNAGEELPKLVEQLLNDNYKND